MTEGAGGGPERMMGAAPEWIGAVFEQGNRKNQVTDIYVVPHEILVPVYDVRKKEEREQWIFENMRVFLDGTVASPEGKWKSIADNWLSELRFAANRVFQKKKDLKEEKAEEKEPFGRKELEETEADLKAIMAVCSSARAMEVSTGTATTYLTYMTLSEGGKNLDVQDTWSDFLLHADPDKLKRVVGGKDIRKTTVDGIERTKETVVGGTKNSEGKEVSRFPLIELYYRKIVEDAGIELDNDGISIAKVDKVDKGKALKGNLVEFLRTNEPDGAGEDWKKKNSLEEYFVDCFLEKEEDDFKGKWGNDTYRWTCAKIAADAFLVNLYTQWEYIIDKEGSLRMKPVPTWGGDPFRAVLEPSFLPRRIKGMYQGKDSILLDLVDLAFRPDDLEERLPFKSEERQEITKNLLKPSATSHLKAYARYSNALWEFFGSSRGMGIPRWDKKIMGEGLPSVVENLDQVYGNMNTKDTSNLGKQILGLMIMRIIHCKALAVALESSRPGFAAKMAILFGDEKSRPFLEVRQFLYGPHMDAKDGFFEDLAGARTRVVFNQKSIFNEELTAKWKETWEILASSDQTPEGRKETKALNTLGFILDSLTAISQTKKRG